MTFGSGTIPHSQTPPPPWILSYEMGFPKLGPLPLPNLPHPVIPFLLVDMVSGKYPNPVFDILCYIQGSVESTGIRGRLVRPVFALPKRMGE